MTLTYIVIALAAGISIGRGIRGYKLSKQVDFFTFVGVMALLFIMGAQIGSNPEVLGNLPILGGKALVLAGTCSLGAVLFSLPLSYVRGSKKP